MLPGKHMTQYENVHLYCSSALAAETLVWHSCCACFVLFPPNSTDMGSSRPQAARPDMTLAHLVRAHTDVV